MRVALLICVLAAAIYGASAANWLQCNFNPAPTIVSLTNSSCTNSAGSTCLANTINGAFLNQGQCQWFNTNPGLGFKTNPQVYLVANASGTPAADFINRYGGNGYPLSGDSNLDAVVAYWNDDNPTSPRGVDIDVVGQTFAAIRAATAIPAGQTRVLVGNYVNNLRTAPRGGAATLLVSVGNITTSAKNSYFHGNGITDNNVFYPFWNRVIPVAVYTYNGCAGYDTPLWSGYINGSMVTNETFIAITGNLTTGNITVWGTGVTQYTTPQFTGTNYTVCNFVNTVSGAFGFPENNVNFTFGAGNSGSCGYLRDDVTAGIIPYGQCVVRTNGPRSGVQVQKWLTVNDTRVYYSPTSSGSTYYQFVADGTDMFVAFYADRSSSEYRVDSVRADSTASTVTCYNSAGTACGTAISAVAPTAGWQTFAIGTYAQNSDYVTDFSTIYVAFNSTYWGTCSLSTYSYRSCFFTVPTPVSQYNVTIYRSPCWTTPSTCAQYYIGSTTAKIADGTFGLVAWYGNFRRGDVKSKVVQQGGSSGVNTCAVNPFAVGCFTQPGAAAGIVPQVAVVMVAIIAAIAALF